MSNQKKSKIQLLRTYLKEHPEQREVMFYIIFTFLAFVCDLITRAVVDTLLKGLDEVVTIWIFPPQALGSLIAFLAANVVAKAVSFILNRDKTFHANNNKAFSIISYTGMSIAFIIIETIVGAPIQNGLYKTFGGAYSGSVLTTASALSPVKYQLCGTLSQMIYGICDFVATYFMDKFIIMRHKKNK